MGASLSLSETGVWVGWGVAASPRSCCRAGPRVRREVSQTAFCQDFLMAPLSWYLGCRSFSNPERDFCLLSFSYSLHLCLKSSRSLLSSCCLETPRRGSRRESGRPSRSPHLPRAIRLSGLLVPERQQLLQESSSRAVFCHGGPGSAGIQPGTCHLSAFCRFLL